MSAVAFCAASFAVFASAASSVRLVWATEAAAVSAEAAFLSNSACLRIPSVDWPSRLAVPRVESNWSVCFALPKNTPSETSPPPVRASCAMSAAARFVDCCAFAVAASASLCSLAVFVVAAASATLAWLKSSAFCSATLPRASDCCCKVVRMPCSLVTSACVAAWLAFAACTSPQLG